MFLTIYYTYATIMQWWRLRTLKTKLNGTLNRQNALLVCSGGGGGVGQMIIGGADTNRNRCLENLLFSNDNRIGCTIVPKVFDILFILLCVFMFYCFFD